MKTVILIGLFTCVMAVASGYAGTLRVGEQEAYRDIVSAAHDTQAGDTIFLVDGVHRTQQYVEALIGTEADTIVIMCATSGSARILGGTYGLHLVRCAFVRVENILFETQSQASLVIGDVRPMAASSNNVEVRNVRVERGGADLGSVGIRLAKVDDFEIGGCTVREGAWYQAIDLVGCQRGVVQECAVVSMPRGVGILIRAGSSSIDVYRCTVEECQRTAMYLGGVSNAQEFRPLDAGIECADIRLYACVIRNSATGVAFDGAERCVVANNTFVGITNTVFTLGTTNTFVPGLRPSAGNSFVNNIVVYPRTIGQHVAVFAGTSNESHTMSNNLWFNRDVPNNSAPSLLGLVETSSIYGQNPMFVDANSNFRLMPGSPAIGMGMHVEGVGVDRAGRAYAEPRSIGAYQYDASVSVQGEERNTGSVNIRRDVNGYRIDADGRIHVDWYDVLGRWLGSTEHESGSSRASVSAAVVWRVRQ